MPLMASIVRLPGAPPSRLRCRWLDLARLGGDVVEHGQDLAAGHAVDGGVMDLRQQRRPAALEAMDEVELPQRPGAVESPRVDPRGLLGQLGHATRRGKRELAAVIAEVEVVVGHPVGPVEVERDLGQPRRERRDHVQPVGEQRFQAVERDARPVSLSRGRGRPARPRGRSCGRRRVPRNDASRAESCFMALVRLYREYVRPFAWLLDRRLR